MKKKELAKNSRKVFSAILAAVVITTSVVPESLVFAADVEESQGFGDSESMGFESGQEESFDGDLEENPDIPADPDENLDDTENASAGFMDSVEAFSSENGNTAEAGSQSQVTVAELQERINALPTVEEFQAMADGTAVEGSTLNQKQTDVYNEAQDIADELDQLSEKEQGQVDTAKLEALFEYVNSITNETALTPSSTITLSDYTNYIEKAGTYNINASNLTSSIALSPIYIRNTSASDNITINILGDIIFEDSWSIIYVHSKCNLTINCNGCTLKNTGSSNVVYTDVASNITINGGSFSATTNAPLYFEGNATVTLIGVTSFSASGPAIYNKTGTLTMNNVTASSTSSYAFYNNAGTIIINDGTYEATTDSGSTVIANKNGGTLSIDDATIRVTGTTDSGQAINNGDSTLNIYSGTIDNGPMSNYTCIAGGTVNMYGGIITAQAKNAAAISAAKVNFTGGTIQNSKYGISAGSSANSVTIGGNAKFMNNTSDIYLTSEKQFTIADDFAGTASVGVADTVSANKQRQITTANTASSMLEKVTSVNNDYITKYDTSGKYLYLWKHSHTWSYSSNQNIITAKCTSDSACKYNSNGLTLTISTDENPVYTEDHPYNWTDIENNITSVTGAQPSAVTYYVVDENDNETITDTANSGAATQGGAPVNAGTYVAKVSIGDATAEAYFTIEKANSNATVDSISNLTYSGSPLTLVTGTANGGTLWYRLGEDGTWQTPPPTATDAGIYKIYYYVAGDKNHENNGSETSPMNYCEVTIAPKEITATATGFDGTYAENVSHSINVTVTDPTTDYTITYSITGEEGSYKAENPTFSKVGNYTVYYRVEAGTNYSPASGSAEIKIAGAPFDQNDVTVTGYSGTYDGTSHSISVTTTGKAEGAVVTYSTIGTADSYKEEAPQFVNATDGAQTVYYKVHKQGYVDVDGTAIVVIGKKPLNAVISPIEKVYDGTNTATVNATVDTGIQNEKLSISGLTGTYATINAADQIEVDVNTPHMNVTGENGTLPDNYEVLCPTSVFGKITPKSITAKITPNGGTYGKVTPAEVSLDGILEADKSAVKAVVKYTGTANDHTVVTDSVTVPEKAGNYTVKAVLEDTAICKNYTLSDTTEKFAIEKAEVSAPLIQEKVYTGANQTADVEISENSLYTVETNEGGTNVGSYNVVLKLKDADNYKWADQEQESAELTVPFVIAQNTNSWTTEPAIAGWTYGESANLPTATAAFGTDTLIVEYRPENDEDTKYSQTVPTNAGNYKVRFTVPGTENYTGLTTVKDLTIARRPVTVEVDNKTITYGQDIPAYTYTVKNGKVIPGDSLNFTYSREEGNHAGAYIITADAEADENPNYEITFTNDAKGTLTIQKKDLTITPENGTKVYGDNDSQFQYSVNGLVKGEKAEDVLIGALARTEGENKGTYAYKIGSLADVSGNYNVNFDENAAEFTITAKEVVLTWSKTDLTYNGAKQSVTATVNNPAFDTDTFALEYTGNIATNAGNYKAKVTALGNENYVLTENSNQITDWSIAKADSQYQHPTVVSDLTYNGAEQELITAGKTTDGTFVYKVNGGEWNEIIPSGLDAGTYEISYKIVGDDNHKDSAEGQLTVTIAKKAVIVSGITAEDKNYDGNTSVVLNYDGVKFDGLLEKDSLSVSADGTFESKNVGERKVLVSSLTLDGASVKNYELAKAGQQAETTAAIHAKEITAVITPNGGIYEGTITPATAVLNGLVGEDNPEITLTYAGTANDGTVVGNEGNGSTEVPTHAGTYIVTVSITDGNYSLKAEGASAQFVVAKADPALSVSAIADKNYGEEAFKLETSNKGDGQKSYISSDEKVVTVDKNGLVTIVGAGKATLSVSLAESANYAAGEKDVTVTVKKVDHKLVVEKLAYEVTYGDKAFKIAASAGDAETDIKFASSDKDVASVSADGTVTVGNVGTAKITVSMDESQNYLTVAKEVTVTVVPKEVTVTPNDASKVYGDKDPIFSYTPSGLVGEDTLSDITLARAEGEDVGPYDITASEKKNANPNYSVKFGKGTFTITQKEIGLTWADTELTYNGKDQQPSASATGLVGNDTCEVTVTGAQKNANAVAGNESYTATAVKLSNKNYKLPSEVTTQYTIGAKEIGIEWSNLEFTYDGTKKQPTAKATGLVEGDTCEITVSGAVAEAGNHTVKAETVDNANYKLPKNIETNFVIGKAETTVSQTPEIISSLTYTGETQNLIAAGQTEDGKFVYKVNGGEWSETVPSGLDAGTYEIFYKVIGDDNHDDSEEVQLTVTIAKKAVVVSGITAEDKTYDGNTSVVLNYDGVKFDGLLEKDSLSVSAEGVFEDKNAGEKKVLVSGLTLDGASVKNYVLAKDGQQSETTATIKAKEITAAITPNGGTYEGTITPATAVLNGLVGEDKPEIILTYTGKANDGTEIGSDGKGSTEAPTHAGTYNVTASITDGNYSLMAEGASAQFVVAKADPTLSVSAVSDKNYGEEAFKLEISNKGDGQKSYTSSDKKVVTVDENGLVTIVGAGKATLTVSLAESANYNAGEKTVTVTVKKIDHSLVVEKIAYEVTYGDPAFKIAANAGDKETDIKFASNNKDVASVSADGTVTIGNVGTSKITISMDESPNRLAAAKEVTVTVVPKEITVILDNASKVYGEKDPELNWHAEDLIEGDNLTDITVSRQAGEDVGSYEITASQPEGANPNYQITFKAGTFTINKADQSGLNGNAISKLDLPLLLAKGKGGNKQIKLSWLKYTGASGYECYWSYCNGKQNFKKFATVKNGKLTATHKKLKNSKQYKYFVVAYKMVNGKKEYIARSNNLHVAMSANDRTNAVSIKVNKKSVTLKKNKTFTIKATIKLENPKKKQLLHTDRLRYRTTNSNVATVSAKGVIKAKGKGTCKIYVLANNGVYKTIKVKVK